MYCRLHGGTPDFKWVNLRKLHEKLSLSLHVAEWWDEGDIFVYLSMRPTAGNINLFFTRETFKKVTKIKFSAKSTLKR